MKSLAVPIALFVLAYGFLPGFVDMAKANRIDMLENTDKNSSLVITLRTDKDVYLKGEEIEIEISFNNVGDKELSLRMDSGFRSDSLLAISNSKNESCSVISVVSGSKDGIEKLGNGEFHLVGSYNNFLGKGRLKIGSAGSSLSRECYEAAHKLGYFDKGELILYTDRCVFVLGAAGKFHIRAVYDATNAADSASAAGVHDIFEGLAYSNSAVITIAEAQAMSQDETSKVIEELSREIGWEMTGATVSTEGDYGQVIIKEEYK